MAGMHAPSLPTTAELTGPDALRILVPAVTGAGGALHGLTPTQIRVTPGRRIAVRYRAEVEWRDGTRRIETLGALAQADPLPDGLAVVESSDGLRLGVWRYPHDPFLPGLPHAAYPEGVRQILQALGIDAAVSAVEPIVYRPGSRAVVRVRTAALTLYVKVVRPRALAALVERQRALDGVVPAPRCLGWSEPLGVVVLQGLGGIPLTRALVEGGTMPSPAALLDLLDAFADVPAPAARARRDVVGGHAAVLCDAVPEVAQRIQRLVTEVAVPQMAEERTIHGDFYEAQVLVSGGQVSGLLDVDGMRHGGALEDPATFIAHLVALAHVHPAAAARIRAYREELEALPRLHGMTAELHPLVTAVLLGLATTSFRRQERDWRTRTRDWVALVETWHSRRGDERALTATSPPPHSARRP